MYIYIYIYTHTHTRYSETHFDDGVAGGDGVLPRYVVDVHLEHFKVRDGGAEVGLYIAQCNP